MSSNSIRHMITSTTERERKLFKKGYHYIYHSVENQIKNVIRANALIQQASVVLPTYVKPPIVIPMREGKKYVIDQLTKRGVHVLSDDGSDRLLVSWASLASSEQQQNSRNHSQRDHHHTFKTTKRPNRQIVVVDSSSSSSSSSSRSNSPPHKAPKSAPPKATPQRTAASALVSKIPEDVERRLEELHMLVLRAASGC